MAISLRNLPSVSFRAVAPEVSEALPRMDVAALVGFAAAGPLDVPVAVEDEVRFAELFGDDVQLARTVAGVPVHAHLGSSVRAFFRNGGAKCYIVRVASEEAACNRFLVPGLMALTAPGNGTPDSGDEEAASPAYRAASLWARSEGAWSDGLRVGTLLHEEPYTVHKLAVHAGLGRLEATLGCAASPPPQPGDLIRIDQAAHAVRWASEGDDAGPASTFGLLGSTRAYILVESVETPAGGVTLTKGRTVVVHGREAWFAVLTVPESSSHSSASPPGPPDASPPADDGPLVVDVRRLGVDDRLGPSRKGGESDQAQQAATNLPARWFPPTERGGTHRFVVPYEMGLDVGSLLEAVGVGSPPTGGVGVVASVGEVRPPSQEELEAVHGLAFDRWLTVLAEEVLLPIDPEAARLKLAGEAPEDLWADRVSFSLWTQEEGGRVLSVERLGFAPNSPRYVGFLPSDRLLFSDGRARGPASDGPAFGRELWIDADHPRFPLAAWFAPEAGGPGAPDPEWFPTFLPIGMPRARRIEATAGRRVDGPGAPDVATRNGLRGFGADLFLDPALADASSRSLLETAFHLQYVLGRSLRGMHAILPLDEVTLVAVPDAVHTPWEETPARVVRALHPPILDAVTAAAPGETFVVGWSEVEPVSHQPLEYLVEESPVPDFTYGVRRVRTLERSIHLPVTHVCDEVRYFRVRAEQRDEAGPWSNTEVVVLPRRSFAPCDRTLPPSPAASPVMQPPVRMDDGSWQLEWSAPLGEGAMDDAELFQVEQAQSADFGDAQTAYQGPETHTRLFLGGSVVRATSTPVLYVRVRRRVSNAWSPWSNTVLLVLTDLLEDGYRILAEPADGTDARRVHSALITMCQARADMTCVLSLPSEYDSARAAEYAGGLVASFGVGQREALGYGAMYHPWTWVAQPGRGSRSIPPDGSVLGIIAARTIRRGAWVAPANVTVNDVVALAEERADPLAVYEAGINVVVREARGFTLLGADTLSMDASLRPLSVRRLLILIRKLALREGAEMLFAPNDAPLRRRIRRRFESVLTQLFAQGAFAGATPDEAFQVVTDPGETFRQNADRGIVVVELRVAPSRPLEFIRVRLVQTERSGSVVIEG